MASVSEFDVVIVGAGPAGLSTALGLKGSGLRVVIIDKERFPRDKVCGGGLSSRSLRVINDLFPDGSFAAPLQAIQGFEITTPDHSVYQYQPVDKGVPLQLGATTDRQKFDEALLQAVLRLPDIEFRERVKANELSFSESQVVVSTTAGELITKMVVLADGAHSQLIGPLSGSAFNRKTDGLALRGIFREVKPTGGEHFVSFYFLKEVFPGYLWIFPTTDGLWNVGVYVPLKSWHHNSFNLNRLFFELIQDNSELASRFQDAVLVGRVESDILPLGKLQRRFSGHRWISAGDSASLIDPLAGEGIGNALMSGQLSAKHLLNVFAQGDFSSGFNHRFDEQLLLRLRGEFLQRQRLIDFFSNKPRFFNLLFRQMARSRFFQRVVVKTLYKKTVAGKLEFYR